MSALYDFTKAAALVASTGTGLIMAQVAIAKEAPVVVRGDPASIRSERVSYAGLDLATERDARKLRLKVASAVKRVCLFDTSRAKLQASDYYACADGAWSGARPQLDRAMSGASAIASRSITVTAFGG
jgi:UrcA family protein